MAGEGWCTATSESFSSTLGLVEISQLSMSLSQSEFFCNFSSSSLSHIIYAR